MAQKTGGMLSDAYFLYSLFLTVKLQLKHTDCPVYAYQYDHKRPPQLDKLIPDFTKNVPGMFSNTTRARDTGGRAVDYCYRGPQVNYCSQGHQLVQAMVKN
ncbi:unnamed protein product [Timema podura]|uniref:Uncharacterized protein n=1 Tax=Timema podura TaxID=61482 RepID=A0ABN7PJ10_TIMPD|nr:unnamed protein product [Timema podura]